MAKPTHCDKIWGLSVCVINATHLVTHFNNQFSAQDHLLIHIVLHKPYSTSPQKQDICLYSEGFSKQHFLLHS